MSDPRTAGAYARRDYEGKAEMVSDGPDIVALVDRPRFCEVDRVTHALWFKVRAGLFRPSGHASKASHLCGIFASLLGHGVDQFEATHHRASP